MATTANPPPGAIPTSGTNNDPFTTSPSHAHPAPLRYASFDNDAFSAYTTNSPAHAKRALEAHLKDTDRRIQDASKLGTTLLQQRKELNARLKDVELVQQSNEVPDDLRQKLTELEREYNEIGKESARAFLPKASRLTATAGDSLDSSRAASVLSTQSRESPSKVSALTSRRQRNQPSNRVHDIEFATEISTQLLAQVRQLQTALAEKDDTHKEVLVGKAQLENEVQSLAQRVKQMESGEQRFKDENWNLETRLQELEYSLKETSDKHDGLSRSLKATESEKAAAQRDLDDLKVSHERLHEEHIVVKRQLDTDLNAFRRDAGVHETEKQSLQRKIEDLTSQNTELAKAVSYRFNQPAQPTSRDVRTPENDDSADEGMADMSLDNSPVKGTPARGGMLESETLKSSLNHAHRMIQNLKNNIHREKTEKLELKRLLGEARDEVERSRDSGATKVGLDGKKRSRAEQLGDGKSRGKPLKLDRLGANRSSTTEILEDEEPDWEDHEGLGTPSKPRFPSTAIGVGASALAGTAGTAALFNHNRLGASAAGDDTTTDADDFETADESAARDTATETEAYRTGAEELFEESEGEVTETDTPLGNRRGTLRAASGAGGKVRGVSPLASAKAGDRRSFESTASTSADEAEDAGEVKTPVQVGKGQGQGQGQKYRLRVGRGGRRSGRGSEGFGGVERGSSVEEGFGTPQSLGGGESLGGGGKSLGDELEGLEGTPGSVGGEEPATPETVRAGEAEGEGYDGPVIGAPVLLASSGVSRPEGEEAERAHQAHAAMLAHEYAVNKPEMVDVGVMTEPWIPRAESRGVGEAEGEARGVGGEEEEPHKAGLRERVGDVVGGALAGLGLGRFASGQHEDGEKHSGDVGEDGEARGEEREISPGVAALAPERPRENAIPAPEASPISIPANEPKSLGLEAGQPLDAVRAADATPAAARFQQSILTMQETEPIAPQRSLDDNKELQTPGSPAIAAEGRRPDKPVAAPQQTQLQQMLAFSPLVAQDFEPVPIPSQASTPQPSDEYDLMNSFPLPASGTVSKEGIPGTDTARPGAGFFAGSGGVSALAPELARNRSRSLPSRRRDGGDVDGTAETEVIEPRIFSGVRGPGNVPTLVFGDDDDIVPVASVSRELNGGSMERRVDSRGESVAEPGIVNENAVPTAQLERSRTPMADEGSQTSVSGQDIDNMLRAKSKVQGAAATGLPEAGMGAVAGAVAGAYAHPNQSPRRSVDSAASVADSTRGPRRPASASSMRNKATIMAPPLPPDFNNKIAAAAQKAPATPGPATSGTMGPPTMPASAYRQNQNRAKTPSERNRAVSLSRDGTTPRAIRPSGSRQNVQSPTLGSRRGSVSSFASELDERFNIQRGQLLYPDDVAPATDPRMIQAITQTMIGEYLWKYTRKAGRSEASNTRHRRFFWVHPYTRTLYWSEKDPSTAGRDMLKAKSVQIESVRVVTDDNSYPPGLHRKSLVVVTPGREIIFTAPTGQRHETWFNALSYLLLRTEHEKAEAEDTINEEDLAEFNPGAGSGGGGFSIRRSISRMTGGGGGARSQSRVSLSSYNSRTTRTSSPQRAGAAAQDQDSLAQRQAAASTRAQNTATPTPQHLPPRTSTSTTNEPPSSVNGRLSSITSRFRRPSSSLRGSFSSNTRGRASASLRAPSRTEDHRHNGDGEIYDASVISTEGQQSAEDLRRVIEKQEAEAGGRVENVRACCDGKHDVASLPRTGRHASLTSRLGGTARHAHGHSHSHPRAEPMSVSSRPRRGE